MAFAAIISSPDQAIAQDLSKEVVERLKEMKDDPANTPVTVAGVKKLLAELAAKKTRVRWDGAKAGPGGQATPDCPGRPPAIPATFKKGWGPKQLLVINRCICQILENWVQDPVIPSIDHDTKIDCVIGVMLHELKHIEDGPYPWPPATPKDQADVEVPAYCIQIPFYEDLAQQPPYKVNTGITAKGLSLRAWIRSKKKQKEDWQEKQNP